MESGCSAVFVDHAVEHLVVPDRGVEADGRRWVVVRRVLVEALVVDILSGGQRLGVELG